MNLSEGELTEDGVMDLLSSIGRGSLIKMPAPGYLRRFFNCERLYLTQIEDKDLSKRKKKKTKMRKRKRMKMKRRQC